MIRPVDLIGHTLMGRYRVKRHRDGSRENWFFVADPISQNRYAAMGIGFGGCDLKEQASTNVMLEISPKGPGHESRQVDELGASQPHPHLLRCLEVGQIDEGDLAGASYVVWEVWKSTLAEVLTRRSALDEKEVRSVATDIATALARYHSESRAHGDVCAERICLVDGQWKLAPVLRRKAAGDGSDAASPPAIEDDIYSLGLALLRGLSSELGPAGEDGAPRPLHRPEIDQALRGLPGFWQYWLGRCLAAEPSQRCTAAELALAGTDVPPAVAEVSVGREGDWYRLQWQPVDRGTVRVYRWSRGRCPTQGEIWLVADIERIAENIPLDTPTAASMRLQAGEACRVLVVTVAGNAAVIGDTIALTWASDVQRLRVTVEGKAIVATWDWPEGAYLVQVAVRGGTFPSGPNDPQARTERCFRAGYLADGRFTVPIKQHTGPIHVAVYAKYRREDGWEYASGRTVGAREVISFVPHVRVHYQIKRVSLLAQILLKAKPCRLQMRVDRTAVLPELVLVADHDGASLDAEGGIPVLELPSREYERGTVVSEAFRPPKGAVVENTRLVVRGPSCDWVRVISEHG